ncbi:hypothetical protein ACFL27_16120 [candidate division CSSED10-310 bacterium]|uniref:Glycosyltransferase RgtA/B/C/D-like domain-containing protein n=1 Tax=candidate division CSSED10-310 bacterium TaxID=2855610 RepID=A0ABV6YZV4_UNCC1
MKTMKSSETTRRPDYDPLKVMLLAAGLSLMCFLIQGNIDINISDEGFLWNGTIQTALGQIPLLDFQSYDPGRYYWGAAWSKIFGTGIMGLRSSTMMFQIFGLWFGLLILRRVIRSWWLLTFCGFLLLLWMFPRHKFFEPSIAMATIFFALKLFENPTLKQLFISGLFIGLTAIMGRNFGLYGFISFFLLIVFIWEKIDKSCLKKRLGLWVVGIGVGYLPMIIMMIVIPGFFECMVQIINDMLRIGYTNMPALIPRPWGPDYSLMNLSQGFTTFMTGTIFIILPFYYLLLFSRIFSYDRQQLKQHPVLVAFSFAGVTYMHFPYSCPDFPHLTQSIHPFLLGVLAIPYVFRSNKIFIFCFMSIILIISLLLVGVVQPIYLKAKAPAGDEYVRYTITGSNLWLRKSTVNLIDTVKKIDQRLHDDEELLMMPGWAGFYPILEKKAPLWKTYFIFPETEKMQHRMIESLVEKNVNWVIIGDIRFAGLEMLHFPDHHALFWRYLMKHYESVPVSGLPQNYQLLHRKEKSLLQNINSEK